MKIQPRRASKSRKRIKETSTFETGNSPSSVAMWVMQTMIALITYGLGPMRSVLGWLVVDQDD